MMLIASIIILPSIDFMLKSAHYKILLFSLFKIDFMLNKKYSIT